MKVVMYVSNAQTWIDSVVSFIVPIEGINVNNSDMNSE